ncbi:YciI family protein [Paucibacter sp. B51]|uniref:YciI family protein n=1 Tax=Paucibacter sp. B51 TaxID=2993315 RepID=UPI0022EBD93D|nr:YciI family protein [Paucibacter sp. B51]
MLAAAIRKLSRPMLMLGLSICLLNGMPARAQNGDSKPEAYDPALARSLGADERGMRPYVLVILKTGPKKMAAGPERDAMFKGHFANMSRLAAEGKLAVAGPLDGVDGWRGLFVFATGDLDEARALAASDPVLIQGEMVAEFHKFYGSAALMAVREIHDKIQAKAP